MANKGNYVKIYRNITKWAWYKNSNTKAVFLHCIIRANWKPGNFEGREIQRGQFVTSLKSMAAETGLTVDEVRTALKHLNFTQEITQEKIPQGLIITVKNWRQYQDVPTQIPTAIPQDSHRIPNNRNIKNNKEK